jgi:DCN1-like protein 1/2
LDVAVGFWELLLPHGLKNGALSHLSPEDGDGDETMDGEEDAGWQPEYMNSWFKFLEEKGSKGVSKDTWAMVMDLHSSWKTVVHASSSYPSSFGQSTPSS